MKTAQEIASKVDGSRYNRKTPPGKAQSTVLDALGIEAESFGHANAIFEAIGISVGHKRVGRSSMPVVSKLDRSGSGFNLHGEGETWDDWGPEVDLSTIKGYMQ